MAQKKLLLFMMLLPTVCFGMNSEIEELVSTQGKTVAHYEKETVGLIQQAQQNSCGYNEQVQEIVQNTKANYQCEASFKYPLFSEITNNKVIESTSSHGQQIYIFVSLSMPKLGLLSLLEEARKLGGTLVLRGLKDNSYRKTAQFLQQIIKQAEMGMVIDPELFKKYGIELTPTFVIAKGELFDKIAGNISLQYALEQVAKSGEVKASAHDLLNPKT